MRTRCSERSAATILDRLLPTGTGTHSKAESATARSAFGHLFCGESEEFDGVPGHAIAGESIAGEGEACAGGDVLRLRAGGVLGRGPAGHWEAGLVALSHGYVFDFHEGVIGGAVVGPAAVVVFVVAQPHGLRVARGAFRRR